jgi:hypothetical protein
MAAGTGETRALRSEVVSYYAGGPWYGYSGWSDYASRNSIACTPGTLVKADDGSMYRCEWKPNAKGLDLYQGIFIPSSPACRLLLTVITRRHRIGSILNLRQLRDDGCRELPDHAAARAGCGCEWKTHS